MAENKTEDEIIGKAYDSQLMKRLLVYVRPYMKYVIIAILLNVVVAALGPVRPYLTKIAIDDYIVHMNYKGLTLIVIGLFGALILQAVIQYLLTYYTQYLGQRTILDLRIQLFAHTERLSAKFFDKTPIGRIVTRVTNDIESLNELFSSGIIMVFSDVFIVLWILCFMFYLDWRFIACYPCGFTRLILRNISLQKESQGIISRCAKASCPAEYIHAGACNGYFGCSDIPQRKRRI